MERYYVLGGNWKCILFKVGWLFFILRWYFLPNNFITILLRRIFIMKNQNDEAKKSLSQKEQKAKKRKEAKEQRKKIIKELDKKYKGYEDYVHSDESLAVYIVRDVVKNINTKGYWINVLSLDDTLKTVKTSKDTYANVMQIVCELYPRITKPEYPTKPEPQSFNYDYFIEQWHLEVDAITWDTAHADIRTWKHREVMGTPCKRYQKWKVLYYKKTVDEKEVIVIKNIVRM